MEQRTASCSALRGSCSTMLCQEMDALYKYVTTVAFAHGVVTPSEEINLYIAHVNDVLSVENSFHNQCLAAKKKDDPTFDPTSDPDTDPQEHIQGSEA